MSGTIVVPPTRFQEFQTGYRVVLTAMLGNAFGINIFTYSVPYFMPSFQEKFGWSRSAVGIAISCLTVGLFICAPLVGRLCDRFGARQVTLVSIVTFGLWLSVFTQVRGTIWTLYGASFLLSVFGAGTLYVSYSRALNTWFDGARGIALGLITTGSALGTILLPWFLPQTIDRWGWQRGFLVISFAALCVFPFAFLFLRERGAHFTAAERPHAGMPFKRVMRDARFFKMLIGTTFLTTAISGSVIHLIPMLVDMGDPRIQAAQAMSYFGGATILGRLIAGPILDRAPGHLVAFGLFLIPFFGYFSPGYFGIGAAPYYAAAIGFALGADTDVGAFLISRYFGMRAYAEAYGWLYAAGALGYALGPLLVGFFFDRFGNYDAVRWIWSGLCLIAALLFITLGKYPDPRELDSHVA